MLVNQKRVIYELIDELFLQQMLLVVEESLMYMRLITKNNTLYEKYE